MEPIPEPEAFVSKMNFSLKFGKASIGASDIAHFKALKVALASLFHSKTSFLSKLVSGAAIVDYPWTNLR